jgi:hypothetical protein
MYGNLNTLELVSIDSKSSLFTHKIKGAVIRSALFCKGWIFVNYSGSSSGWIKIDLNGEAEIIDELGSMDVVLYRTEDSLVFSKRRGKSYVLFDLHSGLSTLAEFPDTGLEVISATNKHFFGSKEIDGKSQTGIGSVNPVSGIPDEKTFRVFLPVGSSGNMAGVLRFIKNNIIYRLDYDNKKYGLYSMEGEMISLFSAPDSALSGFSPASCLPYERDNGLFCVFTFVNREFKKVIVCNYNLVTGDLLWENIIYSPKNGSGFILVGDYLIHAFGAWQSHEGFEVDGKKYSHNESYQFDLPTGEIGEFLNKPIGHWLCACGDGIVFNDLEKGRLWISYGCYADIT